MNQNIDPIIYSFSRLEFMPLCKGGKVEYLWRCLIGVQQSLTEILNTFFFILYTFLLEEGKGRAYD